MASLNLDDGEKKPKDLLDLSNVTISNEIELKKWLEKIPDLKIRLEKVRNDELEVSNEDCPTESENITVITASKTKFYDYPFLDPVPCAMKDVNLRELGKVNINWRMLTLARPKNKVEEDLFSRLVQLEKLQYKTTQWELDKEVLSKREGRTGASSSHFKLIECGARSRPQRGGPSRTAVTETRLQTCKECGEEFCSGICKKFNYEDHARTYNPVSVDIFEIPRPNFNNKLVKKAPNNIIKFEHAANEQPKIEEKVKLILPETAKPQAKEKSSRVKVKRSKKCGKRKKSSN